MGIEDFAKPAVYAGLAVPSIMMINEFGTEKLWVYAIAGLGVWMFTNNFVDKKDVPSQPKKEIGPQGDFRGPPEWREMPDGTIQRINQPPTQYRGKPR